jgi:hypothetical protein
VRLPGRSAFVGYNPHVGLEQDLEGWLAELADTEQEQAVITAEDEAAIRRTGEVWVLDWHPAPGEVRSVAAASLARVLELAGALPAAPGQVRLDLDAMEATARAAQEVAPGPWKACWDPDDAQRSIDGITAANGDDVVIADSGVYPPRGDVAAHIAGMSPDVVIELVARVRAAEIDPVIAELMRSNRELRERIADLEHEANERDEAAAERA